MGYTLKGLGNKGVYRVIPGRTSENQGGYPVIPEKVFENEKGYPVIPGRTSENGKVYLAIPVETLVNEAIDGVLYAWMISRRAIMRR